LEWKKSGELANFNLKIYEFTGEIPTTGSAARVPAAGGMADGGRRPARSRRGGKIRIAFSG
jgi:hypothetical protein